MQDAHINPWSRQSQLTIEMRDSVRELNHRFLDLVASRPDGWRASRGATSIEVSARVAPLSPAQKAAMSNCPYALFDLRFHDERHWRPRLEAGGHWSVAEESADPHTLEFVKLALFFAWHAASSSKLAAQLLLGMHDATAAAFRGATIDCLPALAASEAVHLTARWSDCGGYWSALTGAASRPNVAELRRVQLHGLQLAAAARLA
jgi:hypothetical protein